VHEALVCRSGLEGVCGCVVVDQLGHDPVSMPGG
jgi:hypothetical protein